MHTSVRQLGDAGEDIGEPSLQVDVVEPGRSPPFFRALFHEVDLKIALSNHLLQPRVLHLELAQTTSLGGGFCFGRSGEFCSGNDNCYIAAWDAEPQKIWSE